DAMAVSSTSMKVASMTEAAISQGLTPCAASADWSGGATAAEAMSFRTNPSCGSDSLLCRAKKGSKGCFFLGGPLNCETKKQRPLCCGLLLLFFDGRKLP